MKTIIAPGLKARMLGLRGWFSTNILGNRDGAVLDDPQSFKTKEESKLGVLDYILQPDMYPDLYGDFYHKVRINYYPPRGDDKEGWDNIDIVGWMGYPMQIYFKSPQVAEGLYPEHDLFIQHWKLKNTLRWLMGEEQITHLGMEYYGEQE
jgi:myo-inositol-1-phosphate synthase